MRYRFLFRPVGLRYLLWEWERAALIVSTDTLKLEGKGGSELGSLRRDSFPAPLSIIPAACRVWRQSAVPRGGVATSRLPLPVSLSPELPALIVLLAGQQLLVTGGQRISISESQSRCQN